MDQNVTIAPGASTGLRTDDHTIKAASLKHSWAALFLSMAVAFTFALLPTARSARAGDFVSGPKADIIAALAGRTAFDAGRAEPRWRQFFNKDGTTLYIGNAAPSLGRWDIREGRYCSVWPPADNWVCYGVELAPAAPPHQFIVWIAPDGTRSSAKLYDGDLTTRALPPEH
jgi:hypothetical protein